MSASASLSVSLESTFASTPYSSSSSTTKPESSRSSLPSANCLILLVPLSSIFCAAGNSVANTARPPVIATIPPGPVGKVV